MGMTWRHCAPSARAPPPLQPICRVGRLKSLPLHSRSRTMNRRLSTLIGSLFVAWVAFAPAVGLAADDSPFTGTWSGSFEIHFADGRVVNDTAWLVLQQAGKTVTGSAGPKLDQQSPIQNGAASGDQLTFETAGSQGKVLKVVLKREGERLRGAANGEMGPDKVRIVM